MLERLRKLICVDLSNSDSYHRQQLQVTHTYAHSHTHKHTRTHTHDETSPCSFHKLYHRHTPLSHDRHTPLTQVSMTPHSLSYTHRSLSYTHGSLSYTHNSNTRLSSTYRDLHHELVTNSFDLSSQTLSIYRVRPGHQSFLCAKNTHNSQRRPTICKKTPIILNRDASSARDSIHTVSKRQQSYCEQIRPIIRKRDPPMKKTLPSQKRPTICQQHSSC